MAKKQNEKEEDDSAKLKKSLVEIQQEILKLKIKIAGEDSKSAGYIEKMAKLEALRSNNQSEYFKIKKEINKIEKQRLLNDNKNKKNQLQALKNENELNNLTTKRIKQEESLTNRKDKNTEENKKRKLLEKEIYELQEKSQILMRSFNSDTQKNAELLGIAGKSIEDIAGNMQLIHKFSKGNSESAAAFSNAMDESVQIASSLDSLSSKMAENMENMNTKGYELIDTYQIERKIKEQMARIDINKEKMGVKQYALQKKMLDNQQKELDKLKLSNQKLSEQSKNIKESQLAMIGLVAAIPGGAFLLDKLGLRKILDGTKTIGETIKDWGKSAKKLAITLPAMALGGAFGFLINVVKKLVGVVFELDSEIHNLGKTFTISRTEAINMYKSLGDLALQMNVVGVGQKEFSESLGTLTEEYGIAADRLEKATMKSGMLQGITLLREKFQLTNEEALNFSNISSILNLSVDGLAMKAEKMTKGFMNTRQIFKALANVPQQMAVGMKNASTDLIKFVSKAKAMGIDLKGFQQVLDGFSDIESRLEKQFTAEVITGIHFGNMDEITYAAEQLNPAKAFDLIMQNISKIKDVKQLGATGLKATAELMMMSPEEFTANFNRYKKLSEVFGTSSPLEKMAEIEQMNAEQLRKEAEKSTRKAEKEFLMNLSKEKESADIAAEFEDKMSKIKLQLMQNLLPVIDQMHKTFNEFMNSEELKATIDTMAKTLPSLINGLMEVLKLLPGVLKGIINIMETFGIITKDAEGNVKDINKEWFTTEKLLAGIGVFFFGPSLLMGGIKLLGKGIVDITKGMLGFGKAAELAAVTTQQLPLPLVGGNPGGKSSVTPAKPKGKFAGKVGKFGGLASVAGGLALDYASGKAEEAGNIKTAGVLDIGSYAASGAGIGAMALAPLFGVGAGAGALIGGGIGAAYGLYQNWDKVSGKTQPQSQGSPAQKMQEALAQKNKIAQTVSSDGMQFQDGSQNLEKNVKVLEKINSDKIYQSSKSIWELSKAFDKLNETMIKYTSNSSANILDYSIKVLNGVDINKLQSFSNGINSIATSISLLNIYLSKLDFTKLQKTAETMQPSVGGIFSGFVSNVKSFFGFGETEQTKARTIPMNNTNVNQSTSSPTTPVNINTTALEQKIDKLITVISNMASQPTYIKIGEQTIEAIANEISWKKDRSIGVAKTYSGR